MIAIINFLYFKKPKVKLNASEAQKIIDLLLNHAASNPDIFVRMETEELNDFPHLKGKHVDLLHSFHILFKKNHMCFAIVKTNSELWLYATLDVVQSSYRLIATNKTNPDWEKLLSYATTTNDLSDEDFLKEILRSAEKLWYFLFQVSISFIKCNL